MLGLAKRVKAKILQASTSEVYGDPKVHPQTEDYWGNVNPIGPRACYDEGKRCAETLFFDYHRQHGIRIKVARIFNTYGPRMHPEDGRVVSNFIVQALAEPRHHDLRRRQPDAIVLLRRRTGRRLDPADGHAGRDHRADQSGQSRPNSRIRDLAQKIINLTNSRSRLVLRPLPENDPVQRRPDISLAKDWLGWAPEVPRRGSRAHHAVLRAACPRRSRVTDRTRAAATRRSPILAATALASRQSPAGRISAP